MTAEPCRTNPELLEAAVSGGLEAPQFNELRAHLETCPACRTYWQGLLNDDRLLSGFSRSLESSVSRVEENVLDSLHLDPEPRSQRPQPWRWFVFSPWGRVAAGVFLILACVLFYSLTGRPGPGFTAWAEVLSNIENASAVRYVEKDLVSEHEKPTIVSGTVYYREIHHQGKLLLREYWDKETDSILFFDDAEQKYGRLNLSPEQISEAEELAPRNLLARVLRFEHHDLGERTIQGRRAAGIEVIDPTFEVARWEQTRAQLWVDLETQLPIRFEMTGEAAQGRVRRHIVLEDFEWDVEVAEDDLEPGIPEGYQLVINIPEASGDEAHAIEGLRSYARLTGGRFPSTLSMETALREAKSSFREGELRLRDVEEAWKIYSTGKFYQYLLQQGNDPVYLGNQVRWGEGGRVLLRWRVGDNQYRAILGDLSVREFNGEGLLEAEH